MNLYNYSSKNNNSSSNNKVENGNHTSIYIDDNNISSNNPKISTTTTTIISSTITTTTTTSTSKNNINNNNNNNKNIINIESKTFLSRFGFRSIVIFLILVPYIYILNFAIFPWIAEEKDESLQKVGKIHSFLSMILTIQMLCNYYLCSTTDPGSWKDFLYLNGNVSLQQHQHHQHQQHGEKPSKFCNKCSSIKPERAHHCRYCQRCVLRMDHHCQWLQNCIGLFNHKYFILFLFYTTISIFYFFYLLVSRSIQLVTKHTMEKTLPDFDILHLVLLGFLIVVLIVAVISIMALLYTQLVLIGRGLTTIEHEDKKRKFQQPNVSSLYKNYDKGSIILNYSMVFGPLSINWLLPTPPNLKNISKKGDVFIV